MNTAMWDHVLTRRQLEIVKDFGKVATNGTDCSVVTVVEPMVKKLACGDVGAGALAELDDILQCVKRSFCLDPPSLNGNVSQHRSFTEPD
jgi:phosphopantothenoylcysteine decarboxylase